MHMLCQQNSSDIQSKLQITKKKLFCCVLLLHIPCFIVSGQEASIYKMANEQIRMLLKNLVLNSSYPSFAVCVPCTVLRVWK